MQGYQCGECRAFFVGTPRDLLHGNCVKCKEYCNGYSDHCVTENESRLIEENMITLDQISKGK